MKKGTETVKDGHVRFDGLAAIITGAGGGLGRAYALLLASRGCSVVVNDLGASLRGDGATSDGPADRVVREIVSRGGVAVADTNDVSTAGAAIVERCISAFGRVDIVISNAGNLRDGSFAKMSEADFRAVLEVHLMGTFSVVRAAWPHLCAAPAGRVVVASSAAGLYGNRGQANYASAKMALVGFARTLAVEGRRKGVRVNAVAPIAGSRMTATVLPEETLKVLDPRHVAPVVAWLCHPSCDATGEVFETGAGWCARVRWQRSAGANLRGSGAAADPVPTLEAVRDRWGDVVSFEGRAAAPTFPTSPADAMPEISRALRQHAPAPAAAGRDSRLPESRLPESRLPESRLPESRLPQSRLPESRLPSSTSTRTYTERDVALYALGVGACARGPSTRSGRELAQVYELGARGIEPLPTFAVTFIHPALQAVAGSGSTSTGAVLPRGTNPMSVLHGEHCVTFPFPAAKSSPALPPSATVKTASAVVSLRDAGRNKVIVIEAETRDAATGAVLCTNRAGLVAVGAASKRAGGAGPAATGAAAAAPVPVARGPADMPDRKPDAVVTEDTRPDQALLYRLSGDTNPLHADPALASMGGFDRPILHGLCSFGFAARAVQGSFPEAGPVREVSGRFSHHVFPGDTLRTDMWRDEDSGDVVFQVASVDTGAIILNRGRFSFHTGDTKLAAGSRTRSRL